MNNANDAANAKTCGLRTAAALTAAPCADVVSRTRFDPACTITSPQINRALLLSWAPAAKSALKRSCAPAPAVARSDRQRLPLADQIAVQRQTSCAGADAPKVTFELEMDQVVGRAVARVMGRCGRRGCAEHRDGSADRAA